jgi:cyclopropane-fatty-acyl-phospholipid synthase
MRLARNAVLPADGLYVGFVCIDVEGALRRSFQSGWSALGGDVRNDIARRPKPVAVAVERLLCSVAGGAFRERVFDLRFWDGSELRANVTHIVPMRIVVRDPSAVAHLLRQPNELGLSRAWVSGALDVEGDLGTLLALRHELYGVSVSVIDRVRSLICAVRVAGRQVLRHPGLPESEVRLTGRRRSRDRDRAVIRHHYDLPVPLYRLMLGPSMVYSCAYFDSVYDSLELAQERKLELICCKLQLRSGDRLLDIGCGWGSLLIHAAVYHGVEAVGVTLSPSQASLARERIRQAGVGDQCDVRVADYRDVLDGPYDAIASVGMYEHVGRDQLARYAGTVASLLRPGGLFLNHGIARITPGRSDDHSFISRFVFPAGELHSVTAILQALEATGLEIRDLESLREHYGFTLWRWVENLQRHRNALIRSAGAERERIWRLYMTGCTNAFERGELSVFQTLAARPGAAHGLPLNRTVLAERTARSPAPRRSVVRRLVQPNLRLVPDSDTDR